MRTGFRRHGVGMFAAFVAIGLRLATFTPGFSLRKLLSYDDSAYFGGAQMLVEGHAPYRGFPFVQPPGVVVVGAPFAVIGRFFGGDVGMAALRVGMIVLAGLTCWLIADLLRPYGVVAALAGSLGFATHALPVLDGRTFYLEPFLVGAVVATFWLVARIPDRRRWYFVTGLVLGVACTVKIWAAADVAVFLIFLGVTKGRRRMLAWLAGVGAAIVVVCLPFFVLAPSAMWHQVVAVQLGRGGGASLGDRLAEFDLFRGFPGVSVGLSHTGSMILVSVVLSVALVPLVVQVARRRSPRTWGAAPWWSLIALVELVVVAAAPVFYSHYIVWPAGALALGVGRSVGWLDRRWSRPALVVLTLLVAASLAVTPYRFRSFAHQVPTPTIRNFASGHVCTYFDSTAVRGFVTSNDVPAWAPCRPWPDPVGAVIVQGEGRHSDPLVAASDIGSWQRDIQGQLRAADSAVLCDPLVSQPWNAATRAVFQHRFTRIDRPSTPGMQCAEWVVARPVSD